MKVKRTFYLIVVFCLLASFCKKENKLTKEDYVIINSVINFYMDSLESCQERKTIVISDSTSLKPFIKKV